MIKYLGSKRTLLPDLVEIVRAFPELTSIADVFSGTARVGHAFKRAGLRVWANDHNAYAHCLAQCYVAADRGRVVHEAERLIRELDALPGRAGFFTQTYCIESRFFQPRNGERIDAIRDAIEQKGLDAELRAVLLTSLMEAADRVDSTCGLHMAYVKEWSPRSYNPLELRMPDVLPAVDAGACSATMLDANAAARQIDTDVAYVDPPYNQHSYLANYHIWETLVLHDRPEVYGVARKRVDVRARKSTYNSRRQHHDAFAELVATLTCPLVVVSFNNEGYQSREDVEQILAAHGEVFVLTRDFKRYVGARIGIYNPAGEKVGKVSHVRNEEYIYVLARPELVLRIPDAIERLARISAATVRTRASEPLEPAPMPEPAPQ